MTSRLAYDAHQFEAAENLEAVRRLWLSRIGDLGFVHGALGAHVDPRAPPPTAYLIHNYPMSWIECCAARGYFSIDPIWRQAERGLQTFAWFDPDFRASLTWRQFRYMREARAHGLQFGFTRALSSCNSLA
ncbi:MAG TPA: autoinducer binding domain-containing protein, partial [Verrucomicrobiae bacterium]|nr:autoinducer binding domain-containing protein [Verrucomicrobiae bacterium]